MMTQQRCPFCNSVTLVIKTPAGGLFRAHYMPEPAAALTDGETVCTEDGAVFEVTPISPRAGIYYKEHVCDGQKG